MWVGAVIGEVKQDKLKQVQYRYCIVGKFKYTKD